MEAACKTRETESLPPQINNTQSNTESEGDGGDKFDDNANVLGMSTASEDDLCATVHSSEITAIAKSFIAMAEELNRPERRVPTESSLGRVQRYLNVSAGALNDALAFLESPSSEKFSKLLISREGVLRGVKHLEGERATFGMGRHSRHGSNVR